MSKPTATNQANQLLIEDKMLRIAADYSRDSLIDVIAPYLVHRQSAARRILEGHWDAKSRTILIEHLNEYNKMISQLMGLMPPDTLY